jgi:hypothetical protein
MVHCILMFGVLYTYSKKLLNNEYWVVYYNSDLNNLSL